MRAATAGVSCLLPQLTAPAAGPAIAPRRPNIIIFLTDDMGFSDPGCFGGEIETPHLDRLAAGGLRFTNFYSTARCWPTRAGIMTGHYAQAVRMDPVKPPLPRWTRFMPQYLKPAGYRSYMSGKWHINPAGDLLKDAGFDAAARYDDTDHHFVGRSGRAGGAATRASGDGDYAAVRLANNAIGFLRDHAAGHAAKPFFLYVPFTEPHFPLHAMRDDIAVYRDRYLDGWDSMRRRRWQRQREMGIVNCDLPPLEGDIKAPGCQPKFLQQLGEGEIDHAVPWKDLTAQQQRFQATKMAIHAAMVHRIDREVGRILEQLKAMGAYDDTIVFFCSDNGASAEILIRADGHDPSAEPGSAASYLCLGPGWSAACNTPFRRHKIWVHEGGISSPLIVHWPAGIAARGELRHDPGHIVDFVPTALDLAGVAPPAKVNGVDAPPLHGLSLVPAFGANGAVQRDSLYFNHSGNRALRMGDWKIVSAGAGAGWELHDLRTDRCERVNLAEKEPDRLKQMAARWERADAEFRKLAGGK
jgi:arylsulfatase